MGQFGRGWRALLKAHHRDAKGRMAHKRSDVDGRAAALQLAEVIGEAAPRPGGLLQSKTIVIPEVDEVAEAARLERCHGHTAVSRDVCRDPLVHGRFGAPVYEQRQI